LDAATEDIVKNQWGWWKSIKVMTGLLACSLPFWASESQAVPAFARQTGMVCNSCHIGTDNVPWFTRTGRIWSMRGYVRPYIRERLRSEGQTVEDNPLYGGDYLALNMMDFFSLRLVSDLASGGKNADGSKRDVTGQPKSRISMFYTGPITDWLGLWTEIGYLGNNTIPSVTPGNSGPTGLNFFAYDEFRLSASYTLGENSFVAMSIGDENPDVIAQFNFPYAADMWYNGQGGAGKFVDIANVSIHSLIDGHWWVQLAATTGDNNLSWSNGWNQYAHVAYDLFDKTENDLWVGVQYYGGNDSTSIMTAQKASFICPTTCPAGVTDSSLSFSNSLGFTPGVVVGAPVEQVKNFHSYKARFDWAVADRGDNTWYAVGILNGMKQKYVSGNSVDRTVLGFGIRYFYKRTYGFEFMPNTNLTYTYHTQTGDRKVYTGRFQWGNGLTLLWNPAMNFSVHFIYNPRVQNFVFEDQKQLFNNTGTSWDVGFEYNF
jgi:hypothetical protein